MRVVDNSNIQRDRMPDATPFVRPFRWSRLLFTYVIPLIPLLVLFDGTVSFP